MKYIDIKNIRQNYNISQAKLAELSGFSAAQISSWELKKQTPDFKQLDILFSSLNEAVKKINQGDRSIYKKSIKKSYSKKNNPPTINTEEEYTKQINFIKTNEYSETLEKELNKNKVFNNKIKAIALFSGCGGFTLGFQSAGFDVVGHVEIEDSANLIYKSNFPHSRLLAKDVNSITDNMMKSWKLKYGEIDLIIGGPPCQGFSLAGKRNPNDARSQLYKQYSRIVASIQPKVFVMENVRLLTSMKDINGRLFIDNIIKSFNDSGYDMYINYVNSYEYGVPQSRERVILIGLRKDIAKDTKFKFPSKKYILKKDNNNESNIEFKTARTFLDATENLDNLESGMKSNDCLHWAVNHPEHVIKWLKDVPEGHSAHENIDSSMRPPSGFNTTYKRNILNEPCSTISTNFSMISGCRNVHPVATRSLTIREAARIQSFPDSFIFLGKWGDIRKAIGNAVPPLLAREIALSLKSQIFS